MLKFDADTARLLEIAYQGADVTRRRRASFDALRPEPGDRIADIGCGNGLLTLELARAVGDDGQVTGVDPSADMRALAEERCAAFPNVAVVEGSAGSLPFEDGTVAKAVSLQVFEYLADIPAALAEARRVLRPDGRLVIGDMHWDTLAWHSDDAPRMKRMAEAWDRHLAERCVPVVLPGMLGDAGFILDAVEPVTFCDTMLKPDGLPNMMLHLMQSYAVENGLVGEQDAGEWAEEQRALARAGRFFFSLTHFVVTARRA